MMDVRVLSVDCSSVFAARPYAWLRSEVAGQEWNMTIVKNTLDGVTVRHAS